MPKLQFFRRIRLALPLTAIAACQPADHLARLQVTNGREATDQDPAVVLLRLDGANICTGSYISDDTILTAAHCVQAAATVEVVRMRRVDGAAEFTVLGRALTTRFDPRYQSAEDARFDVGLVTMPAGSSADRLPFAPRGAKVGDPVRLVGFGHNYIDYYTDQYQMTEKGAGERRSGTNTIATVVDGTLRFKGFISPRLAADAGREPGVEVGIGGGDSGAPLLDLRGELVGVASAQNPEWGEWESIRSMESVFVDLASPEVRGFLGVDRPQSP